MNPFERSQKRNLLFLSRSPCNLSICTAGHDQKKVSIGRNVRRRQLPQLRPRQVSELHLVVDAIDLNVDWLTVTGLPVMRFRAHGVSFREAMVA